MTTLAERLRADTDLGEADIEWLHLLIGDWQIVADLSFSDLVLWVKEERSWRAVAHARPNTGPMVYDEEVVGRLSGGSRTTLLDRAAASHEIVTRTRRNKRRAQNEEAIPVVRDGVTAGVLIRHTNLLTAREPSRLATNYGEMTAYLTGMMTTGQFPSPAAPTGTRRGAPRVGDGVIRLDAEARVRYASPNAVSALYRLGHSGDVVGALLPRITSDLLAIGGEQIDESVALVVSGRTTRRCEVSTSSASVTMRSIPFFVGERRIGALVLVRDVSELRRREQELLTKEATIREIHHRVKNNLQTVAALLRLQARRVKDPGAEAALQEAVRRVGTIALVHETLSRGFDEAVDFDEIAVQGLRAVVEVATAGEQPVTSTVTGTFGRLSAQDATPLALILSELLQNAVEHGLVHGGRVDVRARRSTAENGDGLLTVTITDDGVGLPKGFRPSYVGLGTQIVTSLVQDMRGKIRWEPNPGGGTRVVFNAHLRPIGR